MNFEGYFNEHGDILENKLGITDSNELKQVESELVAIRMAELLCNPPKGRMNFSYLTNIHRRLFSDIYIMAGKVRSVDIAKGASVFCYIQYLDDEQRRIFKWAQTAFAKRNISIEKFAEALAKLSADLNALHPFREGNGRTIRTFLILMSMRHGYQLNFDMASTQSIIDADIAAFNGDHEPLIRLYNKILSKD